MTDVSFLQRFFDVYFKAAIAEERIRVATLKAKEESMDVKWNDSILRMTSPSFQLFSKV